MDELEKLNEEKYFGALYNAEEEQKRLELSARNEEIKIGFEEGQESSTKDIALNMYKENIDIETISKVTNLSTEEINELIKKKNKE